MAILHEKVYAVINNTDRVEGRGTDYIASLSFCRATAERLSRNCLYTDQPVEEIPLLVIDGENYISIKKLLITHPTEEDLRNDEIARAAEIKLASQKRLIDKLKSMGITADEINLLIA